MPLQYDSVPGPNYGKLLYIRNNLQAECWCGTGYIYYFACCMPDYGDPTYPQLLIISDAKYAALGSPRCIYYKSCMYEVGGATSCTTNVSESDVTASPYNSCSDPWDKTVCPPCLGCGPCSVGEVPSYVNITVISPKINGTWKANFIDEDPIFNYCNFRWGVSSGPGDYAKLFWYAYLPPGIEPQWQVEVRIGGCTITTPFVILEHEDNCRFTGSTVVEQTSIPPAVDCWADVVGDTATVIVTKP